MSASMWSTLPVEVWHLIASHLVFVDPKDGRSPRELWQVYDDFPFYDYQNYQKYMHPLKNFSQTCKLFAKIALPMLWRDVYLVAGNGGDIMFSLSYLKQLKIALEDDAIAGLVQSMTINARGDEWLQERFIAGRALEAWEDVGGKEYIKTVDGLMALLAEIGSSLPRTDLRQFTWRGIYRPPPAFYDSLSKCSKLTSFTLDLSCWDTPTADPDDYPLQDDPLDRLSDLITHSRLGFGKIMDVEMRGNISALDDYLTYIDLRDTRNGFRGSSAGLVKWLGGSNKLETLELAAPIMYYQSWLLPLWAKLTPQDVDQPEINRRTFGEETLEADLPYEKAAKSFRPLLLESACSTPEDVLRLISEKDELKVWQKWHWRMEGETKTIMERVIAVLREQGLARSTPKE